MMFFRPEKLSRPGLYEVVILLRKAIFPNVISETRIHMEINVEWSIKVKLDVQGLGLSGIVIYIFFDQVTLTHDIVHDKYSKQFVVLAIKIRIDPIPFHQTTSNFKHHFTNIEQTCLCSCIGNQTLYFWIRMHEYNCKYFCISLQIGMTHV